MRAKEETSVYPTVGFECDRSEWGAQADEGGHDTGALGAGPSLPVRLKRRGHSYFITRPEERNEELND